jgi:DDE superfamily endonuclease
MTHDYKRNGTTTLFAALNVLDGSVIGQCMQQHRHQEFIRFLNAVEAKVLAGKVVHVTLDNYAAHKHPKVIAWLARHPRFTFHFTPTSASWLNAIAGFLRHPDQAAHQARCIPLDHRSPGRHQPLHRRAQSQPKAVRLDQGPRKNHRSRQTRAPSVGFYPLAVVTPA